jgi:DICT domain-containing protein
MAGPSETEAPALPDIVQRVDERSLTLTLYNIDVDRSVLRDIQSYFEVQTVELRRATTDDARPRNFVVLHDGDEFVEATDLRSLYQFVQPDSPLLDVTNPDAIEYPDLFDEIDQSLFTDYGYDRMVVTSREIESYAHQHGGTLHAGFQTLSNLEPQYQLYERLADAGVETHIYGAPDWDVSTDVHVRHEYHDEEITETWFVVLDHENDDHKRALLAEERSEDQFYGFWTFKSSVVDLVLQRLEAFPATD